jgi:uncharacterized cupredoxin-like copper-binding protein
MQDEQGGTSPVRIRRLRRTAVAVLIVMVSALSFAPASALVSRIIADPAAPAADQRLTWTASNDFTAYASTTTSAVAGAATIVFETSAATGNTSGMQHTLTFDTTTAGYNHDVNVNIVADPADAQGGHHEVPVNLTPGQYRFFCAIPGHSGMTGVLTVTAGSSDTTPPVVTPTITGTKDAAGNYVGEATAALAATDDSSGVATIEYALDTDVFSAYSAPLSVKTVGAHTLSYRATDKAGNMSNVGSTSFTVVAPPAGDTTPPTVQAALAGNKDANGNYLGEATATLTATDTESGVATVEYALDSGAYTAYTAPVVVKTVGTHVLHYRATDKAGNTSTPGSVSFAVVEPPAQDTTPPTVVAEVAGTKDAQGNYVSKATVTVTATDTQSGVATVEYSLDGGAFGPYTAPVVVQTVGSHMLHYRATDKANNVSPEGMAAFTVVAPPTDTTPPDISAKVDGTKDADGNYVGKATVTVTATDAGSGVASVEYALDGGAFAAYAAPVEVTAAGAHTVKYRAADKAGNKSAEGSIAFTVAAPTGDTKPPSVSAVVSGNMNADWTFAGSAKVTLTATDADSGVAKVEYSLDGAAYTTYTAPVTVTKAGAHTMKYKATDKAGNTSPEGTAIFTIRTS